MSDQYTIPFEGDEHQGTIILLPYRKDVWRNSAKKALECYEKLIHIIAQYEMVYVGIDPHISDEVMMKFAHQKNIIPFRVSYNDAWARDNTLIFVKNKDSIKGIDFGFNAWGGTVDGLYDDWEEDDALGSKLSKILNIPIVSKKDFILEGGSIHTDGEGTLLVTKACLLSKGRNPKLSQSQIEEILKEYLGMKKVIWLEHGIYQDETNEHVDNMACFLKPTEILLATTSNQEDPQYQYSKLAYETLKNETDALGRPLKIHLLEVPTNLVMNEIESNQIQRTGHAKIRSQQDRLAASYINFYQSKKFVIVPKLNHPLDDAAYLFLKKYYADKDVFQLDSKELLLGGGNIHCVTMQIPKGGN